MERNLEIKQFTICLPKELLEKFRYIAARDCRSVSSKIRIAMKEQEAAFEGENGENKL